MKPTLLLTIIMSALIVGCVNRGGGLHNFGAVSVKREATPATVYRCAAMTDRALFTAQYLFKVDHVLDLRSESEWTPEEQKACEMLGIHYLHWPLNGLRAPSKEDCKAIERTIRAAGGVWIIHRIYGSDRTSAVAAYLQRVWMGITRDVLLREAHDYGLLIPGIETFIRKLP